MSFKFYDRRKVATNKVNITGIPPGTVFSGTIGNYSGVWLRVLDHAVLLPGQPDQPVVRSIRSDTMTHLYATDYAEVNAEISIHNK